MNHEIKPKTGKLEQERNQIVKLGHQKISDDLKKAVDLAYKLSVKETPEVKIETLTKGSSL